MDSMSSTSDPLQKASTPSRKDYLLLMKEAEKFEQQGDMDRAVALYKSAEKMQRKYGFKSNYDVCSTSERSTYKRHPPEYFRSFDARKVVMAGSSSGGDGEQHDDESCKQVRREALEYFERYGYVVLDEALSQDEVQVAYEAFKKFALLAGDCDVEYAQSAAMNFFGDRANGLVFKRGIGHSRFLWYTRSRELVKGAFRIFLPLIEDQYDLSKEPDMKRKLITSFDGCNWMRNPDLDFAFACSTTPWFHFDAGNYESSKYLQGFVNILDTREDTEAGLVVMAESQRTLFPHVVPLDEPEPDLFTYFGPAEEEIRQSLGIPQDASYRVPAGPGSLVLWRSAVLHCNTACLRRDPMVLPVPTPLSSAGGGDEIINNADDGANKAANNRKIQQSAIRRLAAYVCMSFDPFNPSLTETRLDLFSKGHSTTHQPDLCKWVGDIPTPKCRAAREVITQVEHLPDGAAELL